MKDKNFKVEVLFSALLLLNLLVAYISNVHDIDTCQKENINIGWPLSIVEEEYQILEFNN